jgi:Bacterial antitoxin of type II TA system, VapB
MPTNVAVDGNLLDEALRIGGYGTKRETVKPALRKGFGFRWVFASLASLTLAVPCAESQQGCSGRGTRAEDLLNRIETLGARSVVDSLTSGGAWPALLACIQEGHPPWIRVGGAVYAGTDAGATSELDVALFIALKRAPKAVLELLRDGEPGRVAPPWVATVCSSNFLIDYPDRDQGLSRIRERISVLRAVDAPALRKRRDACLRLLKEEESRLTTPDHPLGDPGPPGRGGTRAGRKRGPRDQASPTRRSRSPSR